MTYSAKRILWLLSSKQSDFWEKARKINALKVFHQTTKTVPAYKDFLRKNKIKPGKVKTFADFQLVPPISKKDYLRQYPLEDLVQNGHLYKPIVFTATSGTSAPPFYFPRGERLDWEYSILIDLFLRHSSYGTGGPILVILGFGMGVWIGGLITYKAFEITALRNHYPISIITPGINKPEIFNALKNLSPYYKETILVGYPPFVKDIIDESPEHSIDLKKLNLRILTAAESYTEKFRDYLTEKAGIKSPYLDVLNIYGTADIGAMAWETPLSILIRRLAQKKPSLFQKMFGRINKTPTLAQYNPLFVTFESSQGNILLTGNNMIPLVRYAVGDHGGVLSFDEMREFFSVYKINLNSIAKKVGISKFLYQLPFVYVYERADFSTSFYGLQIYPEPIREALLKTPLPSYLTGKLSLETNFDNKQNQHLLIHLEMRKTHNETLPQIIRKAALSSIVEQLELKSSEYRELRKFFGKRALPRLQFWPPEDPKYFKVGIKQKWAVK